MPVSQRGQCHPATVPGYRLSMQNVMGEGEEVFIRPCPAYRGGGGGGDSSDSGDSGDGYRNFIHL